MWEDCLSFVSNLSARFPRDAMRSRTLDFPLVAGHSGYAAIVDGDGLRVAWRCSHSTGGR